MGLFDQDYNVTVWRSLVTRLRKDKHYAWLKSLITPVRYVDNLFKQNRKNNLYRLSHNSQVCYMEAELNDTFDTLLRRIYITDGPHSDTLFIYEAAENKPVFIDLTSEIGTGVIPAPDPVTIYTTTETTGLFVAFIVNVPEAVAYDSARMKQIIDNDKLPGRGYKIVTF